MVAKLAVFDIDGTLCDTNAVDDDCFVQAVGEFIGVEPSSIDWSDAPHITDSALFNWICEKYSSRPLEVTDCSTVITRFVQLLHEQSTSAPDRFRRIPGAIQAVTCLPDLQWDVALATGGWKASARLKLSLIGLDPDRLILSTANDALTRAEIVQTAISRAQEYHNRTYARIVSIGDAPWDVRTAEDLGLPFVGIARGERAARLRAAGATTVLDNLDLPAFHDALDRATVPKATQLSVRNRDDE